MRRLVQHTVLLLIAASGLSVIAAEESPSLKPIFPDKKLEAVVRKYVFEKRETDKPLVEADVVNLSTIEGKGAGITDLTGLEKCVNLAALDLAKNHIKQITALNGLARLQSLNLAENAIDNLAPLASDAALQYLELSHNQVTDLEPLRGLTNLAALYLSDNQARDIKPILAMARLTSLYLDANGLESIDGLGQLKNLSMLSLRRNVITNLSPLKGLNLTWLFLQENKIRDLAPLVEMAQADKEQRFAPFWNVYLDSSSLNPEAAQQLNILKALGGRIHESPPLSTAPELKPESK